MTVAACSSWCSPNLDTVMQCQQLATVQKVFMSIMFILGVGILVVLAFTKQRANLCTNCCDGRPGLKTPLNLLSTSHYRLVYAVIFGLMSNDFLTLAISGPNICGSGFNLENTFCKTVVSPLIITVGLCLFYAPLFACVDTHPYPLPGHALGLLYTCILATYEGINLASSLTCEQFDRDWLQWTQALSDLPIYVFYVILLSWYSYQTLKDTFHLLKKNSAPQKPPSCTNHLKYVKRLLTRRSRAEKGRLMYWLAYIWPYNKWFRYPLKVLGPMVVMVTIMFKLTYGTLLLAALYDDSIRPYIESSATFNVIVDKNILGLLGGTLTISPFISFGLCLLLILHMARSIRKDLQQVARDKVSLSIRPVSHYWKLAASLKYCGYQIGYFVWAWLIYYGVSVVVGCLGILVYIGFQYSPEFIWTVVVTPVIILVWLFIISATQIVMCKFIFIDKKESSSRVLPVANRNLFNWCAFFFFVYNSIVGFFGAMLRVLLSMLFGILLLFRLDANIMMRGFQFADFGHRSYKGFLYVEHTYNNPILNAFVALLLDCQDNSQQQHCHKYYGANFRSIQQDTAHLLLPVKEYSSDGECRKKYIRNRWLVAYTLVYNPCLRQLRASRLKEEELGGKTEDVFAMLT